MFEKLCIFFILLSGSFALLALAFDEHSIRCAHDHAHHKRRYQQREQNRNANLIISCMYARVKIRGKHKLHVNIQTISLRQLSLSYVCVSLRESRVPSFNFKRTTRAVANVITVCTNPAQDVDASCAVYARDITPECL